MIKVPSPSSKFSLNQGRAVKIGEASKILGLHIDTLRRWEKSGKITSVRTPGGTRLYSLDELSSLIPKVFDNFQQAPPARQLPAKNPHRIHEQNIYAHVYNKGVEKRIIFNDEVDYKVFLGFLKDYLTAPKDPNSIKKTFQVHGRIFRGTPHQPKNYFNKIELVAYNLKPDHFHLLLHQKTLSSIENFIRSLCTRYSMYFNKKYKRSGALFEGPYKSAPVKERLHLPHLTRYLHHTGDHSSYPEYLGERETSWVKPEAVLSSFDLGVKGYQDFVEKYVLDQEEKGLLNGIIFENESDHLERRDLARNVENSSLIVPTELSEKINLDQNLKPLQRIPEFLATAIVFLLLLAIGITNIMASTTKNPKPSPTPSISKIEGISTASADAESNSADAVKPKIILTIKTNEASASVNIRQKPTTDSEKIGMARDGDTFEFLFLDSGWYGVKLSNGSTGFISATYIKAGETNN